jgi:hypothetical protein
MADATEVMAAVLALPPFPFARVAFEDGALALVYEGRALARVEVEDTDRPVPWSANQVVNLLAHRAIFASNVAALPPAEAVNAAHQLVEWWDSAVFAIARAKG